MTLSDFLRWTHLPLLLLVSLVGRAGADATPIPCVGDCNGDDVVAIDEILTMVGIGLNGCPSGGTYCCAFIDPWCNGPPVTINCFIEAVNNALHGCGASEMTITPSPSPTPTPEPTYTPPVPTCVAIPPSIRVLTFESLGEGSTYNGATLTGVFSTSSMLGTPLCIGTPIQTGNCRFVENIRFATSGHFLVGFGMVQEGQVLLYISVDGGPIQEFDGTGGVINQFTAQDTSGDILVIQGAPSTA